MCKFQKINIFKSKCSLIAAFLCMARPIDATIDQMTEDFNSLSTAANDAISGSGSTSTSGTPTGYRTISQSDMGLINEYGCWCYFQSDHGKGKGHPVDDIDILCKRLHDGYACAIMDAADLNLECTPWEVDYNSAIGSGFGGQNMDITTLRSECDTLNTNLNPCSNWACKIEGYFVQQLVLSFVTGMMINHDNRHNQGFDVASGCPVSLGMMSEKACCDEQPLRFPYKTYDGARDCCWNNTFNTALYQCCDNGQVMESCP